MLLEQILGVRLAEPQNGSLARPSLGIEPEKQRVDGTPEVSRRRRYGHPFNRAPRAEDGRHERQVSWLTAQTRRPAFPHQNRWFCARRTCSGTGADTRRLQLRGQPQLLSPNRSPARSHCIPFSPSEAETPSGTIVSNLQKARTMPSVNATSARAHFTASATMPGATHRAMALAFTQSALSLGSAVDQTAVADDDFARLLHSLVNKHAIRAICPWSRARPPSVRRE